jgi:hypothetical protein
VIAALLALLFVTGAAADAAPRCYGAADRDPAKPCHNAKLDRSVTPTPEEATITPNVACTPQGELDACSVGVASGEPVVIVGDSHAAHWRAAMEVVAKRKRWHVLEFARPHCPFSFSAPAPTESGAADCVAYNQKVIGYLADNPSITKVFVSNNARLPMAKRGIAYRLDGDSAALRALPASVRDVWVLRDPPTDRATSHDCVERQLKRHRSFAACAVPRKRALVRDPTLESALRLGRHVIDLTRFFCSSRSCFPVVGGVLTHKDQDHLTQDFARTLGPYILRAVG